MTTSIGGGVIRNEQCLVKSYLVLLFSTNPSVSSFSLTLRWFLPIDLVWETNLISQAGRRSCRLLIIFDRLCCLLGFQWLPLLEGVPRRECPRGKDCSRHLDVGGTAGQQLGSSLQSRSASPVAYQSQVMQGPSLWVAAAKVTGRRLTEHSCSGTAWNGPSFLTKPLGTRPCSFPTPCLSVLICTWKEMMIRIPKNHLLRDCLYVTLSAPSLPQRCQSHWKRSFPSPSHC
ncbi:uncharacterized protein LOC103662539 [Ursus maritimus]|uniref:Uncharacterized protein LOC103662539 n=1 Tax=Ursus maritimus TaxID=29073 RepID=A0A8M1FWP9_URSMA|nr:uncharacterized protein LOC103662539 [Ursus maritimus]